MRVDYSRAEEWERRDGCSKDIPLYRTGDGLSPRDCRIVKIVEGDSETELAWDACAEQADAVVNIEYAEGAEVYVSGFMKKAVRETIRLRGVAVRCSPGDRT